MEAALTWVAAVASAAAYLVDADWLAKSLGIPAPAVAIISAASGRYPARGSAAVAAAPPQKRMVVLHAEWADGKPPASYLSGHIPGAMHFDTDWLENGYPRWLLLDVTTLQQRFAALGLRADDTLVVYAQAYDAACRLWWVLRYCGAQDVRVLAGGLTAWRAAGLPLDVAGVNALPIESFAIESCAVQTGRAQQRAAQRFDAASRDSDLIGTKEVRALLGGADPLLIDVRTSAEFAGRVSGYDYLDRAGRIPGACHAAIEPLGALLDGWDFAGIADYWRDCGLRLPVLEASNANQAQTLQKAPTDRQQTPIFYCGSGWRSSVAVFCAACLGSVTRNYSAGWGGWSTHYVADRTVAGSTPGWRQEATDNPIVRD